MLEQFLPRYNRRFQIPPQYPEPAFRPLDPELCLEQILCFKHRRKVARDNTVRFQLDTLQLLPGPERPSYAGATVAIGCSFSGVGVVFPKPLSPNHRSAFLPLQHAATLIFSVD